MLARRGLWLLALLAGPAAAFPAPLSRRARRAVSSSAAATDVLPGRWRLAFRFPNDEVTVIATFVDEVGYEPPCGRVLLAVDGAQVDGGRWQLSEDPDDVRDGLWIWGLFKDPLYPFLLMTLESSSLGLPEGGALAIRINHKSRPSDDAPLLTRGTVARRTTETAAADLAGLGQVTYNVDSVLGTVVAQLVKDSPPAVS
mmetsp:Transcript_4049/g.14190  ORF Transcript_4049/g.14190 Transcript_4049/m.14190 type:complete len:199 (+) Transcript_4049:134-730(+)